MAESIASSKSLRAGLRAAERVDRWDEEKRPVQAGYSPQHVRMYCVEDARWQAVRLSMKGVDTVVKLEILEAWWDKEMIAADDIEYNNTDIAYAQQNEVRAQAARFAVEVQVGNYLGALRRGGQLDDKNRIRKAR